MSENNTPIWWEKWGQPLAVALVVVFVGWAAMTADRIRFEVVQIKNDINLAIREMETVKSELTRVNARIEVMEKEISDNDRRIFKLETAPPAVPFRSEVAP